MGFQDRFKRNQVEAAILAAQQENDRDDAPDLRVRIKRLLDADRLLGHEAESDRQGSYAFYSHKAPGSGTEVWFSGYEAFALLVALRLLDHGWPQGTVVRLMRQVRQELELAHRHILEQNPAELFNEKEVTRQAAPGVIFTGNINPVFLAITAPRRADEPDREPYAFAIRQGQDQLMKFIVHEMPLGMVTTSLELVNSAHRLAQQLAKTQPSRRGRAG